MDVDVGASKDNNVRILSFATIMQVDSFKLGKNEA
jgi:hypothetical protein